MGVGFFDLIAEHKIWVLTKVKYQIVGEIWRNEQVTVRTWPLPPSRVNYRREYLIKGSDGRRLVIGTSEWVIVHSEKRRVLPAENLYPEGEEFCMEQLFQGRMRHVPHFQTEKKERVVYPAFSQLDLNGHVNNIQYANFVMDALQPDRETEITRFQIDYHRELLQDRPVMIQLKRLEECVLAQGVSEEGELMFSCKLEK